MSEHIFRLPWRADWYNGKAFMRDRAGAILAEFTLGSHADAELAVRAVNEREGLLAENERLQVQVERLRDAEAWIDVETQVPDDANWVLLEIEYEEPSFPDLDVEPVIVRKVQPAYYVDGVWSFWPGEVLRTDLAKPIRWRRLPEGARA